MNLATVLKRKAELIGLARSLSLEFSDLRISSEALDGTVIDANGKLPLLLVMESNESIIPLTFIAKLKCLLRCNVDVVSAKPNSDWYVMQQSESIMKGADPEQEEALVKLFSAQTSTVTFAHLSDFDLSLAYAAANPTDSASMQKEHKEHSKKRKQSDSMLTPSFDATARKRSRKSDQFESSLIGILSDHFLDISKGDIDREMQNVKELFSCILTEVSTEIRNVANNDISPS